MAGNYEERKWFDYQKTTSVISYFKKKKFNINLKRPKVTFIGLNNPKRLKVEELHFKFYIHFNFKFEDLMVEQSKLCNTLVLKKFISNNRFHIFFFSVEISIMGINLKKKKLKDKRNKWNSFSVHHLQETRRKKFQQNKLQFLF